MLSANIPITITRFLEPIFFEVLNEPIKSREKLYSQGDFSTIPYLNGGLFSPHVDDYYKHANLTVPDEWLTELFTILEIYNFTIDENTSFDEELSIDPEMLGRIFENLLAEINPETGESARKSTGSYYTPRTIVDYMVDESLLIYLQQQTGIAGDKLRAIISYDLSDDVKYASDSSDNQKIVDAISKITIIDPACGSGAFPIGALQKIVFILQQIDPQGHMWFKRQIDTVPVELQDVIRREFQEKNFDYIRKLGVIRENIFGVDIQPIATEISRLRCFLTLIVDQSVDDALENRGIVQLPNLDFKFVTANSLIGLPDIDNDNQADMFDDRQDIDELKSLRDRYFIATGQERSRLTAEFSNLQTKMSKELIKEYGSTTPVKLEFISKLADWEPFTHKPASWFNPEWMFGIKDGFDIVIGNPPYVGFGVRGSEKISQSYRKEILRLYPNSAEYKINLYPLFIERALILCKNAGIQSFIVPDSFLLGKYFSKIRKYILDTVQIIKILLFSKPVFGAIVGYSVVYIFKKTLDQKSDINVIKVNNPDLLSLRPFSYSQETFEHTPLNRFRLYTSKEEKNLVEKIEKQERSIKDLLEFKSGLISKIGQKEIVSNDKKNKEWLPGIISGGEVDRYSISWANNYIRYKKEVIKSGYGNVSYFENKIFVRQTGDKIISAFDDVGYLCLNNVHVGNLVNKTYKPSTMVAILNSRLVNKYYEIISLEKGRVMAQIDIDVLESIPVPVIDKKTESSIGILVDQILTIKKQNKDAVTKDLESQIDQLVYKLASCALMT